MAAIPIRRRPAPSQTSPAIEFLADIAELQAAILDETRAARQGQDRAGTKDPGGDYLGGYSRVAPMDPAVPVRVAGLAFQYKFARVYTVCFSVSPSTLPPNPTATITFMTRGNRTKRVISVRDGSSISGVCDALDIDLIDESAAIGAGVVGPYSVTMLAAPGTRPAHSASPSLRYYPSPVTVLPGASTTIAVPGSPGGLGIVSALVNVYAAAPVFPSPLPTWEGLVTMQQGAVALGGYYASALDATHQPLIPGTDRIVLTNQSPSKTLNFALEWGIDG